MLVVRDDGDRGCVVVVVVVGLEVVGVLWLDWWFGIVRLLASCEWSRRIFASDIGTWLERCGGGNFVVVIVVFIGVEMVMDFVGCGGLPDESGADDRSNIEGSKKVAADTTSGSVSVRKTCGKWDDDETRDG